MVSRLKKFILMGSLIGASVGMVGHLLSCGPLITEPMPDIPQAEPPPVVEYHTVRLEYGDDDILSEQSGQGLYRQMLVGQRSQLALFTKKTILETNIILFRHLSMIAEIRKNPPTHVEDGLWVWEAKWPQHYVYFEIKSIASDNDHAFKYFLRYGTSQQDSERVFEGIFHPGDRVQGRQRGFGTVRFDFDALRQYDAEAPHGRMVVAFRVNQWARQVRVGFFDFKNTIDDEPLHAIYRYVQHPNLRGRFLFFGWGQFRDDAEQQEFLGVDAIWNAQREGIVKARLLGENEQSKFVVHQCWDRAARVVYSEIEPRIPAYRGGEFEDCAPLLRNIPLEAPEYEPPGDENLAIPEQLNPQD